jgi:exodeoxyribonuclease-3
VLTVATANVNGIRAAVRRGMAGWLAARRPDLLCLQEVRASDELLAEALGPGWSGVHDEAEVKGRAGVAVMSRTPPLAVRSGLAELAGLAGTAEGGFDGSGRWVEADLALDVASSGAGLLTAVSAYVHTGEADTPRQDEKYRFLEAAAARLAQLTADGRHVLLTGDLNVAHREADLKNWKGNLKKAGFLPGERAWFDRLFDGTDGTDGTDGDWVDVHRALAGPGPGPYTWWSWRGKAFDNDAGWRIDYQIASSGLAARAVKAEVDRAPTYAARWSDHAPVVVEYELDAVG